ncbi:MAG: hypothetical protein ACOCRA_03295 [Halobacteria archaeon]
MSSENTEQVSKTKLLGFGVLALAGIAAVFAVGVGVASRASEDAFPVYAVAFFLGAWSTVTATFVVNYISRRIYGSEALSYGFPSDG